MYFALQINETTMVFHVTQKLIPVGLSSSTFYINCVLHKISSKSEEQRIFIGTMHFHPLHIVYF